MEKTVKKDDSRKDPAQVIEIKLTRLEHLADGYFLKGQVLTAQEDRHVRMTIEELGRIGGTKVA